MMESIKMIGYDWKIRNGESAILRDLLIEMQIPNFQTMEYKGFIHALARGIMIANKENGWKGGFSFR